MPYMNRVRISLLFSLCLLLAVSCKRDKDGLPQGATTEVHILGEEEDATGNEQVVYWVNGIKKTSLANSIRGRQLKVYGSNVYILGSIFENGTDKLAYLKNEQLFKIEASASSGGVAYQPMDITVAGNDVYVLCNAQTSTSMFVGYFKNNVWVNLVMPADLIQYHARSLLIKNSDVHVAGSAYLPGAGAGSRALYWKNNLAPQKLESPAPPVYSFGRSIGIDKNGKVVITGSYIYGDEGGPCFWRDGVRTDLPMQGGATTGSALGIFSTDENLYIHGTENKTGGSIPCYWKDDVQVLLNKPTDATDAYTTGIAVVEADIYVSGYYRDGSGKEMACYWKNGTFYKLSDAESETQGIVVIKK